MTDRHHAGESVSPPSGVAGTDACSSGQAAVLNSPTAGHEGAARDIPKATVARLASYLRVLYALDEDTVATVSSEQLAEATEVGSATLRKDLSFLGSQGVRGVGYEVSSLTESIESALGLDLGHRIVLVGVGNLGAALIGHGGFGRRGFAMVALFDVDPEKVGSTVRGLRVQHVDELSTATVEPESIIGVIATPPEAAQEACDRLVAAGVRSILNFAPAVLKAAENVEMRRVDLAVEMQVLSFGLARNSRRDAADSTTAAAVAAR